MSYFFLIGTAVCATLAFLTVVASLALNPRSPLNRAVALNGFLLGIWAIGAGLLSVAETSENAWFWYRFASIGSLLNAPSIVWFFLSFSEHRFIKKLFVAFPFYAVNGSLLIATWNSHLWYSDFVRHASGWIGVPTNPTAWAMFYVLVLVYVWAFFYLCSNVGYSSARLSWLGRQFRGMLVVSVGLYVAVLLIVGFFDWPDFSGLAYALVAMTWIYQIFRYGFLRTENALSTLDHILSLEVPLALLSTTGQIVRSNDSFAEKLETKPEKIVDRSIFDFFPFDEDFDRKKRESVEDRETPIRWSIENGRLWFEVVLTPLFDSFDQFAGWTATVHEKNRWKPILEQFSLSDREQEIALLLIQGLTTNEISQRTFISTSTVRVHVFHIFEKTGAKHRADLMRIWRNLSEFSDA